MAFVDGNKVPDFHATPGHATGGRSVAAAPYDGRGLGEWIAKLRPPLDIVSVGGMGIASGADLNHFVNATRKVASARHAAGRFLRHGRDLALHRRGMQLVNGNALVARLLRSALDKGVAIRTRGAGGGAGGRGRARGGGAGRRRGRAGAAGRGAGDGRAFRTMRRGSRRCSSIRGTIQRRRRATPATGCGWAKRWAAWWRTTWCMRGPGRRCRWCRGADGSVGRFPHLVERAKPGFIAVDGRGAAVCQ